MYSSDCYGMEDGKLWFKSSQAQPNFHFEERPYQLWGPSSSCSEGHWGLFPQVYSYWCVKLAVCLHLLRLLRMHQVQVPHLHMPS
jgi:hypothetical protein